MMKRVAKNINKFILRMGYLMDAISTQLLQLS